jgi:hypothetical protein
MITLHNLLNCEVQSIQIAHSDSEEKYSNHNKKVKQGWVVKLSSHKVGIQL